VSAEDLDDLLAIEAAGDADRARNGDADAGERLLDSLLRWLFAGEGVGSVQAVVDLRAPYLHALRARLGIREEVGSDFLGLLGLTPRPGRRPKSGPGSRAEAARRLRLVVDLAREGGAPAPLLEFYLRAAGEIEAGAAPRVALGLRRRRGRPREPELPLAIAAAIAHWELERPPAADLPRHRRPTKVEESMARAAKARETIARLSGRGSSPASTANALRKYRPRRPPKPSN